MYFSLTKADAVEDMIGFPDYIKDPKKLKEKYNGVSTTSMCMDGILVIQHISNTVLNIWNIEKFLHDYDAATLRAGYDAAGNEAELRKKNYINVVRKIRKRKVLL